MISIARALTTGVLLTLGTQSLADTEHPPELYSVAIDGAAVEIGGAYRAPEALVRVDRPCRAVTLALHSAEPVRWLVEATEHTSIARIVLTGPEAKRSEVWLGGEPFEGAEIDDALFIVRRAEGPGVRRMARTLPKALGFDRLSGHAVDNTPPKEGIVLDRPPLPPVLSGESGIEDDIKSCLLPASLRRFMTDEPVTSWREPRLSRDGFHLTQPDGSEVTYPVTLDVPPIGWPTGAAYDPELRRFYGISVGGGCDCLYQYDIERDAWSVLESLGSTAWGMILDRASNRLIIGNRHRGERISVFGFATGLTRIAVDLPEVQHMFWGPYDAHYISPLAVEGNILLVAVVHVAASSHHRPALFYVVDLGTAEADLVGYHPLESAAER